jgi:hypothetical protein
MKLKGAGEERSSAHRGRDLIKAWLSRADDRSRRAASAAALSLVSEHCRRRPRLHQHFRAATNRFSPSSAVTVCFPSEESDKLPPQLFLKAVMPTPRFNFIEHIFVFALFAEVV